MSLLKKMNIQQNLQKIKTTIPSEVTLVAVSKTKPISDLMEAYDTGQRIFGENKIQEMVQKYEQMPKDTQWHMIGHVQTNKVKYIAEFVHLIHGVDSFKLLKEINKQAQKYNRIIDCLLQIKIAKETTKYGISVNDAFNILTSKELSGLKCVRIIGLMGMATFTSNESVVKNEFKFLKSTFEKFKALNLEFKILSMGMSGDYQLAIDCGSTMVRVGSSIFGERRYQ